MTLSKKKCHNNSNIPIMQGYFDCDLNLRYTFNKFDIKNRSH